MSINHDALFKQLIRAFSLEFLELFAPEVLEYGIFDPPYFMDTELFRDLPDHEKREADLIVQGRFAHDENLVFPVHIEIQSHIDPDIPKRMYRYSNRLFDLFESPVHSIALFTYDTVKRSEPDVLDVPLPYAPNLMYHYFPVQLKQLHWREFVGQKNPILSALMSKMYYERHERAQVKVECLRLLAELGLPEEKELLIGRFVETYLPLDEKEMLEYNRLKEALPMAKQRQILGVETYWERMGRLEGERVGEMRGERRGEARVLVVLLEQRFGLMPQEDRARLNNLSSDEMDKLAVAVLTALSYDEWRERLLAMTQTPSAPAGDA